MQTRTATDATPCPLVCQRSRPRCGPQRSSHTLTHGVWAAADLVVLSADPLDDIGVLADPSKFVAVIKGGIVVCRRPELELH